MKRSSFGVALLASVSMLSCKPQSSLVSNSGSTEKSEVELTVSDPVKDAVKVALSDTDKLVEGLLINDDARTKLKKELSETKDFILNPSTNLKFEKDETNDHFYFVKSKNTVFYNSRTNLQDPFHVAALVHETWHAKRSTEFKNEHEKSIKMRDSSSSLYEECMANYITVLVANNQTKGELMDVTKSFMYARSNATSEAELMVAAQNVESILKKHSNDVDFMQILLSYALFVYSDTNKDVVNRKFCDQVKGYYMGNKIETFDYAPMPSRDEVNVEFPDPLLPYHNEGAFVYEPNGDLSYIIF